MDTNEEKGFSLQYLTAVGGNALDSAIQRGPLDTPLNIDRRKFPLLRVHSCPFVVYQYFCFFIFASLICLASGCAQQSQRMDLARKWRFAIDRQNQGNSEQWFARELPQEIYLPGSMQEQRFGDPLSADTPWVSSIGQGLLHSAKYAQYQQQPDFRTPFWLTPRTHYLGLAWYQRDITIPAAWKNSQVALHLERVHWRASAWLDSRFLGTRDSLGTPDEFDLGPEMSPGKHRITLCIDNRLHVAVGLDAHSVSDQTETDWNGIVGEISLRAQPRVCTDHLSVYPDVQQRSIHVIADVANHTGIPGDGTLFAQVTDSNGNKIGDEMKIPTHWDNQGGKVEFDYALGGNAKLWDEFSPNLYRLAVALQSAQGTDRKVTTFGLRQLSTRGTQFILNNHPIMLRGTLECCIFPLTGYPPTTIEPWQRIYKIAKAHGLNHIRFHSWCPPEAAFKAADEMGMYLSVECSCWAKNFGEDQTLDTWITAEAERMRAAYGNHPSFMFMVPSNEPGKGNDAFLANLISKWQSEDPRRLYTAGSGWPKTDANQYDVEQFTRLHQSGELKHPPETASDYRDYVNQQHRPSVVHEMGQWCVYPNFDEIPKYTGSLRAGNLEIFQDMLNKSGMGDQAHDFFMASGKFQTELYKAEIEEVLRTPGIGGFQLLDLHDFPGQGTAPVGVLDAFWDERPYVNASQYRRFCNTTVLLARFAKRVFTNDETADVQIDVSHFGPADLQNATVVWRFSDAYGQVIRRGEFHPQQIPTGKLSNIGNVELPLGQFTEPSQLKLEVSIDGTPFSNSWNFWVYPGDSKIDVPANVSVVHDVQNALSKLKGGGRVLLLLNPKDVAGNTHGAFEPVFWNRITFPKQINHTLGILCDPASPALAKFPTDDHTDWQWWDLQQHCKPMILSNWPAGYKPIVQMIDDWDECRKLALVAEANVNSGKLLICSIDLRHDMDHRPAARAMLRSLLDYAGSEAFSPQVDLTVDHVKALTK